MFSKFSFLLDPSRNGVETRGVGRVGLLEAPGHGTPSGSLQDSSEAACGSSLPSNQQGKILLRSSVPANAGQRVDGYGAIMVPEIGTDRVFSE